MPGEASGEVMRIDETQGAEKHRRTQCRRRTCRDARLAKTTPGRNARFAGMKLLKNRCKAPRNIGGRKAGEDRAGM
jgi:hypothetical protein